ncbi:MAG: Ig-like domain-containing protein [Methanobacterium paludis]|nr:Ig-like domain-containing protein [Methanobacterium paludis]
MNGGNSTVTVDLLHANNETIQDPTNGHVPDGIPVNFTGTLGTLNSTSSTLLNGQATSIFTGNSAGTGSITATINNYSVSTSITIIAPPAVTKVDPTNKAVNIAIDKVITITFNKPIKIGTKWFELKTSNGTVVSVNYSIIDNVLTITPSALTRGTKYALILHTGSVTDLTGNNLAYYGTNFATTTDSIAPTVKSIDPVKKAVNVAVNKVIKITFSETIKAGTLWFELKTSNGTTVNVTYAINGNILTLTPSALTKGTNYTLILHTGSVKDLAGNNLAYYGTNFATTKN